MKPQLLIGAATSGSGKTTFTMGLLRALHKRGLRVQPLNVVLIILIHNFIRWLLTMSR